MEKAAGVLHEETPLAGRSNSLFLGTHVVSGTARAVVVRTGAQTEFSRVSQRMALGRPETEFERGVRHFGYLLMEVTLILIIVIFAINVALTRPVLDSILFSLALAVGLTPQLLPAVAGMVGLPHPELLTGEEIARMSDLALVRRVGAVSVFAEVEPNQKERILLALKQAGNVVGYLGDGINDASALHAADVGISVETAVDVAKEAADIVLLEKGLDVLAEGSARGGSRSRIRSSTSTWPPARISGTCSAWRGSRWPSPTCRCSPSRSSCSTC